ncbi:hypothetical protein PHLH6_11220 [Pseudomonas sp. Seg1]|uniref:DUF4123 domain-containing protein n=1 Tax=Pseudomonas sp. Seg1 TaxID=2678259 RepID=UPI001BB33A80|nr:DUF4123 domain-containing protein [Pseudomonas sp. Seg1]BBP69118.1 hypothetical protein PHLH6_11220 [Pseudomonas sp. Seg1]
MNTWILLERPAAQLETLYRLTTHPDTQKLFAGTSLNGFAEHSPLLVRLDNQSILTQAIEQTPAQWPGLLIESACDMSSVLAHLRQILFVNFDQQRKGVLRYSNPTVASYFFAACTAQDLSLWLGPINELRWFGATWATQATGESGWQQLNNLHANDWHIERTNRAMVLSAAQEEALTRQRNEQFLYRWWRQHPQHSYVQAAQLMAQALTQGIDDSDAISAFLSAHCTQAQS